jgi:hypothetical protein
VVPVVAVLVAAPLASATVSSSSPALSKVKWRPVLNMGQAGAASVWANDRYVAFQHGLGFPFQLTLIDDQTGQRKQLSPADCPDPDPLAFDGPWLQVQCPTGVPLTTAPDQLYDLSSGSWVPLPQISPECAAPCGVGAVGRYWMLLSHQDEAADPLYPPAPTDYLQNLATGQLVPDPVTPGGTVIVDLNSPSGTVPLCPPLRYPSWQDGRNLVAGGLTFYGQFAVTYGSVGGPWIVRLRKCGSNLDLRLSGNTVASSRAVIMTQDGFTFHGWFLPSLRRFTIRGPQRHYPATPVALTDRTIYVYSHTGWVWAASLPTARPRSRH